MWDISVEAEMEKAWTIKLNDLHTQHQADLAARDAELKALQEQLQRYVDSRSRVQGIIGTYTTVLSLYVYMCVYVYITHVSAGVWAMVLLSVVAHCLICLRLCISMCMTA